MRSAATRVLVIALGSASFCTLVLATTSAVAAPANKTAAGKAIAWHTGRTFEQALKQPIEFSCANRPLGPVLSDFAEAQRLAIWLDRRVDPDQNLEIAIDGEPVRAALERIASHEHLGMSVLKDVVYVGPREAAAKLRTLSHLRHEDLNALPATRRKALGESRAWSWDDLATPRELLALLAREAHVELRGAEQIPHDLWPARRLPALDWVDRLTLAALQFDLTFTLSADGKSAELVPVPDVVATRRSYPAGSHGAETVQLWSRQLPDAHVKLSGDKIVVEGRLEDLESIVASTVGSRTTVRATAPAKQVYKLTTAKELEPLLDELSKRLDLEFQLDRPAIEAAGISLTQIVTVKVQDATLDELIDAVLSPAKLKATRHGRTVKVVPAR